MNNNVMSSRVQMEPSLLQHLVAEVKETIAIEVEMAQSEKSTSFKAIDFWNIRRNGRSVNSGNARKAIILYL
jgi:hypothetical protein